MISHHGLPAFAIYKAQFAFSHAQSKHLNKKSEATLPFLLESSPRCRPVSQEIYKKWCSMSKLAESKPQYQTYQIFACCDLLFPRKDWMIWLVFAIYIYLLCAYIFRFNAKFL